MFDFLHALSRYFDLPQRSFLGLLDERGAGLGDGAVRPERLHRRDAVALGQPTSKPSSAAAVLAACSSMARTMPSRRSLRSWTLAAFPRLMANGVAGSGLRAGASMRSKALRRQPGSFLKGRLFRSISNSAMARFELARGEESAPGPGGHRRRPWKGKGLDRIFHEC